MGREQIGAGIEAVMAELLWLHESLRAARTTFHKKNDRDGILVESGRPAEGKFTEEALSLAMSANRAAALALQLQAMSGALLATAVPTV